MATGALTGEWLVLLGGMRHWLRLVSRASPGARLVDRDGVVATVVPATPERSMMNSVIYNTSADLASALPKLSEAYRSAGVRAWTVWVPLGDPEVTRPLGEAGHVLDAAPEGMIRDLEGAARPPADLLEDWTEDGDPAVAAAVNDRSYPFGEDSFIRAVSGLAGPDVRVYVARLEGEPVATVITSDHAGNCEVDLVATVPEARGRGISGALMGHALADAQERGCKTTTLVATRLGRPVYERLGYRPLGGIEMWERRE